MSALTITSGTKLPSGHTIPYLGLGVYLNEDAYDSVLTALKHGYRHIDTAELYQNEDAVGRAVRDSGIPREEIFVTTKIAPHALGGTEDPVQGVQGSFDRLNLGYVDLWLIHSAHGSKESRLKTYKALLAAKARGDIRDIGVSNYNVQHIEEIKQAGLELPAVNQVELHPFCRQDSIVEYCKTNGILVSAYCPLVRGDFKDPVLQEVSKKVKKSPPQVLVRWSIQRGFIPLPKSANPERIVSNAEIFDFELSAEDMQALDTRPQAPIGWNPIDVE